MNRIKLRESIESLTEFSYSRSGGPGGQNVNKVNSKVTALLKWELLEGVTEREKERIKEKLGGRINGKGEIVIQSEEERSQVKNRSIALERLFSLLSEAGQLPKKRRPTKPGRAARENRLSSKRKQKEKKALRRTVSDRGD
jgi:ribosome-associated protein